MTVLEARSLALEVAAEKNDGNAVGQVYGDYREIFDRSVLALDDAWALLENGEETSYPAPMLSSLSK